MTAADLALYERWRACNARGESPAGIRALGLLEALLRAAPGGATIPPVAPPRAAPSPSRTVFANRAASAIGSHLRTVP